jgi:hypothetical protein
MEQNKRASKFMYDPVIAWNVIGSSHLATTVTDEKVERWPVSFLFRTEALNEGNLIVEHAVSACPIMLLNRGILGTYS